MTSCTAGSGVEAEERPDRDCASGGADWPKSSDEELSFRSRRRR